MWIYISTTTKKITSHAKLRWEYLKIQILQKYPQVIVEKTKNSTNSSSYTIEYKLVRNSHLSSQNWLFFLKCHSNCSTNKCNCSHTKLSKQQLTAHKSIVKGYTAKCYKHAPFSSKRTIVVTGVSKPTNISAQITEQINLASIVNYNINIS